MRDLVKLAKRIDQIIPEDRKSVQEIYNYLTSDYFCISAIKHLSAVEILKVCFLINGSRRGHSDLYSLLNELQNIFLFSTIYFSGERRFSCYDCGGDGYVRCSECGGNGTISCSNCDGTGTIEGDDGEIDCGDCDGTGDIDCPEQCDDGYVNCDNCDGGGDITDDGLEYTISIFASYSSKLKSMIKNNFDAEESLSRKMFDDIADNSKTMLIYENDSDDESIDVKFEAETYINGFKDSNELSYLDKEIIGRGIRIREDDLEEVNRNFY